MKKKWQAQWIIDPEFSGLSTTLLFHKEMEPIEVPEHKESLKNRHMLIRKTFHVKQLSGKAIMNISGDDYYKLFINGRFVGQGPAPGYHFDYNYNQFDVSDYLIEGSNVIAVHVYYQGLVNRVWNSGDYRQGLIAELIVDDVWLLGTDASWKYQITEAYKSGGITGYKTQYLENFDSRLYNAHWIDEDYDDNDWQSVELHETCDYTFKETPTLAVSVYNIYPIKVEEGHINSTLIDFGQEVTGQFQMSAQGMEGQIIEIRCGEELDETDPTHVRYELRCNCTYQEYWTLSGNMDTLNTYDYKAFRYVEIIVPEGVVIEGDYRAVVRHYPFDDQDFTYESSNERVDQIINICKNGVKYGTQEVYVDCPTREKGQYLGDFTVTGHTHIYLTGKTEMYKKALSDFAESSKICPGLMAVAPGAYMQEIADFSMQWPMQLYQYYRQSGDALFLEEMYPILEGLEEYFEAYKRGDGLLVNVDEKWNLVDWPDNLRDNYDCELSKPIGDICHNVLNAHYYNMLHYIESIRKIIDVQPKNDLNKLKKSFIKVFYSEETQLFVDAEGSSHSAVHSNALPLLFDLFPNEDISKATELIINRAAHCGVQVSYFVLKALSKVKAYDSVYNLIELLWGTMVDEGATTCFEAWGKDQKFNTSLCHPWASAPIPILIEELVGINPAEAGWKKIAFTPHLPTSLETFKLSIKVQSGEIKVEKVDGKYSIQVPDGVEVISNYTSI